MEAGRERKNLLPVSELAKPLSAAEFVNAASFLRKQAGRKKLLVSAAQFQREFPDHVTIMRQPRGAGPAKTEGGEQPKLTIKAPSPISRTGRDYCVVIGPATA